MGLCFSADNGDNNKRRPAVMMSRSGHLVDEKKGLPDRVSTTVIFESLNKSPLEQHYTLSKDRQPLGQGNQGSVKLATSVLDGKEVAVKTLDVGMFSSALARTCAANEVTCLKRMDHPNIVRMLDAFYDKSKAKVHIVMERLNGPRMTRLLATQMPQDPTAAAQLRHKLVLQLVDAVAYMHSKGVIYRDLHPENTMVSIDDITRYTLKIIDFGSALPLERSKRLGEQVPQLGSSLFQAPEVEEYQTYGQQADMWGVGVFAYLILTGDMPFSHNIHGIYQALRGEYYPLDDRFGNDARDFIAKLINVKPRKRMNASQCRLHRFLRSHGEEGLVRSLSSRTLADPTAATKRLTAFDSIDAQVTLTRKCVDELAMLSSEQFAVIRQWLNMVSEMSVHGDYSVKGGSLVLAHLQASQEGGGGGGPLRKSGSGVGLQSLDEGGSLVLAHLQASQEGGGGGGGPLRKSGSGLRLQSLDGSRRGSNSFNLFQPRTIPVRNAHSMGMCTFGELLAALEANGHTDIARSLKAFHETMLEERGLSNAAKSSTLSAESVLFRTDDLMLATEKRRRNQQQ